MKMKIVKTEAVMEWLWWCMMLPKKEVVVRMVQI